MVSLSLIGNGRVLLKPLTKYLKPLFEELCKNACAGDDACVGSDWH